MIIDKEKLFLDFYNLKKETSIPLQAFMKKPEMKYIVFPSYRNTSDVDIEYIEWRKKQFYREYVRWMRRNNLPQIVTSVEQFLTWICREYNKDLEPTIEYYHKNAYRLKIGYSLSIAVSVFSVVYPEIDRNDLISRCGVGISTLDIHTKRMSGDPSPIKD